VIAAEVVDAIVERCRRLPDTDVLAETSGRALTGRAFAAHVCALAEGFLRAGLKPGDPVLFAIRPSGEAIAHILAILRAGGVVVAADLRMGDDLFFARMHAVRPKWLVAEPLLLALTRFRLVRALLRPGVLTLPPLAALAGIRVLRPAAPGFGLPAAPGFGLAAVSGGDPAFIVFTSGTTAAPKAVVHTQASLGGSVKILAGALRLSEQDVVYSGELHAIVPALLAGARVIIPRDRRFEPGRFVSDVRRFGVSHVFGTPSDFATLIGRFTLPSSVRAVLLGAAPVDRVFLARFQNVVDSSTEVWVVYGMTEMLPVARVRMADKLADTGLGDLVGEMFPEVVARLAEDGELLLRGPHLFRGYLGEPVVDEHAAGDLATFDAAGRLVLLGRKKDMIIRGHDNIYPSLYEPAIAAVPGVRRCSLVGVYREAVADEQVVLVVEPESGIDPRALEPRLRHQLDSMDPASRPDRIVFGEIPLSGRSRKVDKRLLLQWLRDAC
jgi:acyl-CoA synthetase (AMP-forming)/AMP-acid ligase II